MKFIFFIIICQISFSQDFKYNGQVVCQDLIGLPGVKIFNKEETLIATTDFNGYFEIKSETIIDYIRLDNLSFQTEEFHLKPNCFKIEIIYLNYWIYDFVTLKTANRKLKKDRKKFLKKAFDKAYEKKIFVNEKFCELIYQ